MTGTTDHATGTTLRVAVIGAGSWGTALACLAARTWPTLIHARRDDVARSIRQDHANPRYLPGISLPTGLDATQSFDDIFSHLAHDAAPSLLILGVPVAGMPDTLAMLAQVFSNWDPDRLPGIVWSCKGFDAEHGRLPHEIADAALVTLPYLPRGIISGPSFAKEVAQGLPVALTVASSSATLRARTTQALHGGMARVYGSEDVIGVEVGGALKNVMAIASGIGDGLELGTNARAALITRGLAEMTRLGLALGARPDTFAGLTGLGDLVLTATGELSRNRQVGIRIGQGQSLDTILAGGMTAEGVRCARAALLRARAAGVELPITEAVCRVLFEGESPRDAVAALFAREARAESLN